MKGWVTQAFDQSKKGSPPSEMATFSGWRSPRISVAGIDPRSRALLPEVEQPGVRTPEAAAAVERLEVVLVVDVEPLRTAISSEGDGLPDQRCSDTPPLEVAVDAGVEEESMRAPIPGHVHETDEPRAVGGAHPPHAAGQHRLPVSRLDTLPRGRSQCVEVLARDGHVPRQT